MISLLIALILYEATNLKVSENTGFYNHNESTICPFGVVMSKIGIIYLIFQDVIVQLFSKKNIRLYGLFFLVVGMLVSLLNKDVFIRMIPVFVLEYVYIFYIVGKDPKNM